MVVKVGDTVVSLVDLGCITKGREYEVLVVDSSYEYYPFMISDDEGNDFWMLPDQFYKLSTNTQYLTILETLAGDITVDLARKISEALTNAS